MKLAWMLLHIQKMIMGTSLNKSSFLASISVNAFFAHVISIQHSIITHELSSMENISGLCTLHSGQDVDPSCMESHMTLPELSQINELLYGLRA